MKPLKLTERQRACFDCIVESIVEQGYPPTVREIGEYMGISSTNGVNDHLKALERKGWIQRDDGARSRAIRVLVDDPRLDRAESAADAAAALAQANARAEMWERRALALGWHEDLVTIVEPRRPPEPREPSLL